MSAWTYLKPAKEKSDPPEGEDVDAAEKKQVKGETKNRTERDEVNKYIEHVDDFYDDLASARDALWEAMSRAKALSSFYDSSLAIGRISRMMVYLRLKRQIKFHNWNAEQLKEQIPYWRKLFVDNEIEQFIKNHDYFPTDVGESNAERAKRDVYDALDKRNKSPNTDRDNRTLQEDMQTVIHYYIDTFNVTQMNTFLDKVYGILIGKQVKEVDDSVDDNHLRYMIQKIRQEREKRAILIQSMVRMVNAKNVREKRRQERQIRVNKRINQLRTRRTKQQQRNMKGNRRRPVLGETNQTPQGTSVSSQERNTSSSPERKKNRGNTQRRSGRNGVNMQ